MWTADFSKSNVPFLDVRTVPAWMLDPATLDPPELREWLAEITGRWLPWKQVASVGEPSPTIPEEDDAACLMATSADFRRGRHLALSRYDVGPRH